MKTHRFFHQIPMALIGATITIFLVACTQSQPPTVKVTPESKPAAVAAPMKDVYVVFEGPWAIAPDPKDASFVVLVAPKTKAHRDLVITASNGSELAAGAYELSIPARAGAAAGTFDESILRVKIDPQAVQRVLDDKSSNRYAIRLPKPDAYLPASRHRSRVSASYPPEEASEKEYATEVSMRYNVGNLSGFTLSGSPDVGSFNPLLLQVETDTGWSEQSTMIEVEDERLFRTWVGIRQTTPEKDFLTLHVEKRLGELQLALKISGEDVKLHMKL